MSKTMLLGVSLMVSSSSAAAQQPGANDARAATRKGFADVSGWVTKAAELVPADKYNYKPVQTVRTFGQLVAHVVDSYAYKASPG